MNTHDEICSLDAERKYINVLKGSLIILVVIGHFGQSLANIFPHGIAFVGRGLMLFIYSFHMPLFLFVSGYLSSNIEKRRKKAFIDLFIPYLLFQLFVGVCILLLNGSTEVFSNIFVPQMGAWYLMALYIFRLVMPDLERIRFILIIAVLLNLLSFTFSGIGKEFAMTRVLGFFIYFYLGFITKKANVINKVCFVLNRAVSMIVIIGFATISIIFAFYIDIYSEWISIFTRDIMKNYNIGKGVTVNLAALIFSLIIGFVFLNAVPKSNKVLERIGEDTMPLYLSHLVIFMAFTSLKSWFSWSTASVIAIICVIFSIVAFSSQLYRKLFNGLMKTINRLIFLKDNNSNG